MIRRKASGLICAFELQTQLLIRAIKAIARPRTAGRLGKMAIGGSPLGGKASRAIGAIISNGLSNCNRVHSDPVGLRLLGRGGLDQQDQHAPPFFFSTGQERSWVSPPNGPSTTSTLPATASKRCHFRLANDDELGIRSLRGSIPAERHCRGIRVPIYLTVQWDHYASSWF